MKILMLEDSASDAKLIKHNLSKNGLDFEAIVCDNREDFIRNLVEYRPDIVLSDHKLWSFNSLEALTIAKEYAEDIPFILVTGTVSEEFAVSIIKSGAEDYILKGNLSRLPLAIESALLKKKEKARLKKNEEQFQHTIDSIVDGIQIIGYNWEYLYVNDVVAAQGKYPKTELIGHTMMEKYPGIENTALFQQLSICMSAREIIYMENEFTLPDGTAGWFKLSIQPAPQGVLVISRDITEKKRNLLTLEEKNKKITKINAELDRFLYSTSHELRTPVCQGLGLINLARDENDRNEMNLILDKLETSITNMDAMLKDIRVVSEINKLETVYQPLEFNELLLGIFEKLKNQEGFEQVKFKTSADGKGDFFSDKNRIGTLLECLISNGIKFRSPARSPRVDVKIVFSDSEAVIEVSDNGEGIEEADIEKIFNAFYRANDRQPGNGLGLYIVSKIAGILKAEIKVNTKLGSGSSFTVVIPNAMTLKQRK